LNITGTTSVYGIVGYPVKHSLSPAMQTVAFKALGIDAVYVPFNVHPQALAVAIDGLRALGIKGVNVTVPHKETVVNYLDSLSGDAQVLSAVNVVKNTGGFLEGYNTDVDGFLLSMKEEGIHLEGKNVTVIGAGGAGRAVGYAVLKAGARLLNIVNRNFQKAKSVGELLSRFGSVVVFPLRSDVMAGILESTDILINATSVGMSEEDPPLFDYSLLSPGVVVVDVIYSPAETQLLAVAKSRGCKTANGLGMLLYQGALSFEIWTGTTAPVEVMRKALLERLYGETGRA